MADGQCKSTASSRRISLEPRPSLPRTEDTCRKPKSPGNNNHSRLHHYRKAAASGCQPWPKPTEWQLEGAKPLCTPQHTVPRLAHAPSPGLSLLVGEAMVFLHSWFRQTAAFLQGAVQSCERQTPTCHTGISNGVTLSSEHSAATSSLL